MTDQNMFSEDNTTNTGDPGPSFQDQLADKLKGIVNEQGEPKYKDPLQALDALVHSQGFIDTLKTERQTDREKIQQLEAELEKRQSVEEVVASLTKQPTAPSTPAEDKTKSTDGFSEDKIKSLVDGILSQRTAEEREAANLRTVQDGLVSQYGDKAKDVIRTKAQELHTTAQELEKLARTNPVMALTLLGGVKVDSSTPAKQTQTAPRSPVNQEAPAPKKGLINGGASTRDLLDEMALIRESVYKKYDVQS